MAFVGVCRRSSRSSCAGDYMTDYFDPLDLGPLVLSLVGIVATLIAFVMLQRYLAKRLPSRRVRKSRVPVLRLPCARQHALRGLRPRRDRPVRAMRRAAPRRRGSLRRLRSRLEGLAVFYWGYWIGPAIAVVLALWLRPTYLALVGVAALIGFRVSFGFSESHYGECDPCPRPEHILIWVNGILFTITPALLLLAVLKPVFLAGLRSTPRGTNARDA